MTMTKRAAMRDAPKDDEMTLVEVMLKLRADFGRSPSYNHVWHAVVTGTVPAKRMGRAWKIKPTDYPTVVATFGMSKAA